MSDTRSRPLSRSSDATHPMSTRPSNSALSFKRPQKEKDVFYSSSSPEESDTFENADFDPALERRSHLSGSQRSVRFSNKALTFNTIELPSGMKTNSDSVQRWCALTLEQYKDDQGRRTAAGIQGAHVIPNAMGPKEVRPHPLTYPRHI